jgi:hypothetical protein
MHLDVAMYEVMVNIKRLTPALIRMRADYTSTNSYGDQHEHNSLLYRLRDLGLLRTGLATCSRPAAKAPISWRSTAAG